MKDIVGGIHGPGCPTPALQHRGRARVERVACLGALLVLDVLPDAEGMP